ncbi:hypothetical protein ACIG5E_06570 [Kitasatospora sp. NPDC053057]|uniref:hypothetical protein n=1 Tax=Kitasatospora sp. NPDC053057 TaxID=3364062 RepID=UPI0037C9ABE5
MRSSTRLVTATAAALLCVGALSACGPDNGGQDGGKTAAPAPTGAAPTGAAPTGAPATGGSTAKPTGGASKPADGKGIPAKAWMDTKSIPMDETYHYAPLAANAKSVTGSSDFKGMQVCHSSLSKDDEDLFTGGTAKAMASVGFGGDRWTAQQTLFFFGDPTHSSGTGQSVGFIKDRLTQYVKDCGKTAPGATVKMSTAADAPDFAATLTVPQADGSTVTLHEYVINAGGTVSELSVWATTKGGAQPKDAWKAPEDKYVFTGMTAALCEVLPGCD